MGGWTCGWRGKEEISGEGRIEKVEEIGIEERKRWRRKLWIEKVENEDIKK